MPGIIDPVTCRVTTDGMFENHNTIMSQTSDLTSASRSMSSFVSSTPVMTLDHLIQQDDPQHHTFVVIVQDISPYQQKILALPTQNSEVARATGGKQSQIKQTSSALIGDSTKQFVKLTLWGEKARVLDERQGPDAVHIGDIVVCSGFYICNRRGTIEIRGRRDSRMAVMLRNDVYHPQSSNIKMAQIQSLLDARGQILLLKQESSLGVKSIAEARENMILSLQKSTYPMALRFPSMPPM